MTPSFLHLQASFYSPSIVLHSPDRISTVFSFLTTLLQLFYLNVLLFLIFGRRSSSPRGYQRTLMSAP
jgi:hypothetical protein